MVIVGLVAFAEPPLDKGGVPLTFWCRLSLLGFWYFAACRVAGWIPVVLIVAAAIGLVTAFRDQEMPLGKKTIQLPDANPPMRQPVTTFEKSSVLTKTIITPPPTAKK